jgi:peptide maturation system protein, TIGR04066 family
MVKKKLLVYPFTQEFSHIAKYSHLLSEYNIASLVLPSGLNHTNIMDTLNVGSGVDAMLSSDFNEALSRCDAVLFTAETNDYEKRLDQANAAGKQVLVFDKKWNESAIYPSFMQTDMLKRIDTPIVMVYGQGALTQKFDIQLGLCTCFIQTGYKVLSFGTKEYASLFGMNTFPDLSAFPMWIKALHVNRIVYEQARRTNPNIIIIGVPGGIVPMSEAYHQFWGEDAMAYSIGLKPDVSIISVYENLAVDSVAEKTSNYMKACFGNAPDFIHVANTRITPARAEEKPNYLHVDNETVHKRISAFQSSYDLFNINNLNESEAVYQKIVDQLHENVPVVF